MGPCQSLALLLVAALVIGGCQQQGGVPSAVLTGSYHWSAAGAPLEPGAALVLETLDARPAGAVAVSGQLVAALEVAADDVHPALSRLGFVPTGEVEGWGLFESPPAPADPALVGVDVVALDGSRLLAGPHEVVAAAAASPAARPAVLAVVPDAINAWVVTAALPVPPGGPFGALPAPEALGAVVGRGGRGGLWVAVPPEPREQVAAAVAYRVDTAGLDDVLTAEGPRWHDGLGAWWLPVTWTSGAATNLHALQARLQMALVGG